MICVKLVQCPFNSDCHASEHVYLSQQRAKGEIKILYKRQLMSKSFLVMIVIHQSSQLKFSDDNNNAFV